MSDEAIEAGGDGGAGPGRGPGGAGVLMTGSLPEPSSLVLLVTGLVGLADRAPQTRARRGWGGRSD